MISREINCYGWKPDLPDYRDLRYGTALKAQETVDVAAIPQVDLTVQMPPIQDQGQAGTCTGHAAVAVVEHNVIQQGQPFVPLSRLFPYYNARAMEGTTGTDGGAYLRDIIKAMSVTGNCREDLWPYDLAQLTSRPDAAAYTDGIVRKIRLYAKLNDLDDMILCLAAGYPFLFGMTVYSAFESDAVAASGIVDLPASSETVVGGHAVCAVGYDMESKRFRVRNSWGTDWGQAGYFTLPFDYLTDRGLSDNFWTIRF